MYSWSPLRVSLVITSPVMLSLAVGCLYMAVMNDVQTAWTISSYILSAVSGKLRQPR